MKVKKILIGITTVAVLTAASIFIISRIHAQEQQAPDQSEISAKLDQILNNEKALMDQIASMRQELNIVKIRVTQSQ